MFHYHNYAIAHIPKCGGHALAKMMNKALLVYAAPFKVVKGEIIDSGVKHQSFSDFAFKSNIKYFCLIRKLDDWWKSFMWHQSKHTRINANGNMDKVTEKSYSKKPKETPGHLLLPKYTCYSVFPDHLLNQILGEVDPASVSFLRMEYLRQDFCLQFGITLPEVPHTSTYSPPKRYWTDETKEILYKNNPLWAQIEKNIYSVRTTEDSKLKQD